MGARLPLLRLLVGTLVALILVALTLVTYLGREVMQHDYYSTVRTALVNARLHLAQSSAHEQELLEQAHLAHQELAQAIAFLERVEDLDPALRKEVEALQAQLSELDDDNQTEGMSPQELREIYRELMRRLEALIQRY